MQWKSDVKYNQDPVDGTIFSLKGVRINIRIHKIIHLDGWYLSSRELNISQQSLNTNDFSEAVSVAKEIVRDRLEFLTNEYQKFIHDESELEFVRY